jgi:hypothetical protein
MKLRTVIDFEMVNPAHGSFALSGVVPPPPPPLATVYRGSGLISRYHSIDHSACPLASSIRMAS